MYVDDLATAALDVKELDWFEDRLQSRFVTKPMGEISMILGIKVIKDRAKRTVELNQEIYLDKVLNKFRIPNPVSNVKNVSTLIDGYNDLRPASDQDKKVDAIWYREDLAEHHALALKRLMRYLRFTISFAISFGPLRDLVVYSDADYDGDKDSKKSISAAIGLIRGGLVFFGSRKQTFVATAITKAEYAAICYTAKQGQWVA
ncbi:retrotransposon protein, putative, Ty1-copia subclass [Drepanopeziza brunnea f. sp. 'multigermtubi' MB_m1]|uniref:Retrotransposon protein, putative, Ty1-copia subclass n=1 Tax=Marssonina brunnea f. sp. multigermtubi (strain MB_m1) TaxID=1072389 RepID=K1WV64_MARBU|nr:retrotransposon protein, putative, Ty1-copia subclass [Drepanopeziza brunnea f. sp. 'multigermtubi' MB_m1]EKD12543.1 retrotransposon protein, putative, Ty1-copia subclass [Drepanopeziza brunnea f. sp. 'multigermtubi' MB_m1]